MCGLIVDSDPRQGAMPVWTDRVPVGDVAELIKHVSHSWKIGRDMPSDKPTAIDARR